MRKRQIPIETFAWSLTWQFVCPAAQTIALFWKPDTCERRGGHRKERTLLECHYFFHSLSLLMQGDGGDRPRHAARPRPRPLGLRGRLQPPRPQRQPRAAGLAGQVRAAHQDRLQGHRREPIQQGQLAGEPHVFLALSPPVCAFSIPTSKKDSGAPFLQYFLFFSFSRSEASNEIGPLVALFIKHDSLHFDTLRILGHFHVTSKLCFVFFAKRQQYH